MTRILVAAVVPVLLAVSPFCGAASRMPTTDSAEPVDQIVVTGARTPLGINRIGSATTVITRAEIERRQARYVSDLLRSVPGFAVSHTGVVGSQTQVRVRGAEANHVLVLIDGVRANDPATGDEFRWEHLATGNIERIEIIRGPQSALWGSDAVGAVVHVITRGDSTRSWLDAYAEGGSNDTQNIGASGVVQSGDWSFHGGIESLYTRGSNISRTGTEDDGADLLTGSLAAKYSPSNKVSFDASVRVVDATAETDPVDFFTTGLPTDGDRETNSDNLVSSAGATWLAHESRVTYRLNARYFDSAHHNLIDGVEDSSTAAARLALTGQADIWLGENRLSLALEHEGTDYEQRGAVIFGDPNQDQRMQVASVATEYQHLSGSRLSWILSARFDEYSDFDDVLTGKASLAYKLRDDTRLRGSVGTGHKTPTFTERFGFFPGQFIGNPDLKPETSISFDVGVDRSFLDGALELQASVYWQELENEINGFVFDPVTFLATAQNGSGTSERAGIEFAARWQLNSALSADLTYTYTDSSEENAVGQNVTEVRRPRHAGNLLANYVSARDRIRVTLAANYGGTRRDFFFPPFPEPQQTVTLDPYWLVDVTVHYRLTDAISFVVRSNNLLDEDYEQVYGYRTSDRTVYMGLRATFGK